MLRAVENGAQAALMAPTETLAEQHHRTLDSLLGGPLPVELLTGSTSAARRRELLDRLASGQLQLVVGTHALIEEPVEFRDLAVVVVDEQHRFGVRQRAALDAKAPDGLVPHALHMTATPIPRTLSLSAYGDLDATVLRELPSGRRPVDTHVVDGARARARAYERIREEIAQGRQCFVVCPLVEESEALQAKAATAEFERLRTTEFADLRVELIHGQMPSKQKAAAMKKFAAGEADVLVATSVIEVGIDVPNATVMLIEAAERYGLSQLHQLRGRVGRGEHASLCIVFGDPTLPRLEAIARERDGFRLAEVDLELRGAGDVLGTRQHGLPEFRVARLPEDVELLVRARDRADQILIDDPAARAAGARAPARGGGHTLRVRARPDSGMSEHPPAPRPRLHDDVARGPGGGRADRSAATTSSGSCPGHPEGGVRRGPEGVIEFFHEWVEPWEDFELDWELQEVARTSHSRPSTCAAWDARAASRPRWTSRSSGPTATAALSAWSCSTTSTRRAAPRGSHDRTTRSHVRARLARRRSGCRVRGSARRLRVGRAGSSLTAPSATGRTPSRISSATGSSSGTSRTRTGRSR